jgi:hypothetical protein
MIDWLVILLALAIIAALLGIFGFMAWEINVSDPSGADSIGKKDDTHLAADSNGQRRKKDKNANDQSKKKRKDQKKVKVGNKVNSDKHHNHQVLKEPSTQTSEETDNEREESDQVNN